MRFKEIITGRILEKTELSQYAVPLMGIGWSLGFLAFWSMALMLKDSFIVCQFLNFLGASLTKVEMSGIRHVWGAVLQNFIVSLVYCTIIVGLDFNKSKYVQKLYLNSIQLDL